MSLGEVLAWAAISGLLNFIWSWRNWRTAKLKHEYYKQQDFLSAKVRDDANRFYRNARALAQSTEEKFHVCQCGRIVQGKCLLCEVVGVGNGN